MKAVFSTCLLLSLVGCAYLIPTLDPGAAYAQVDQQYVSAVQSARASCEPSPQLACAQTWSQSVQMAIAAGSVARGALAQEEVDALLGTLMKLDSAESMLEAAAIYNIAGRRPEAAGAAIASLAKKRTPTALELLVTVEDDPNVRLAECKATRKAMTTEDDRYRVLSACARHGDDLSWATAADRKLVQTRQAQELAERQAAQQAAQQAAADRAAQQAAQTPVYSYSAPSSGSSSSASSGSSSSSSAPSVVSVTLHNDCSRTVKLFLGKNVYSSGTQTSLSSNTTTSYTFKPGDTIWILDESGKPLTSYSVSSSSKRVNINSSCSGFVDR